METAGKIAALACVTAVFAVMLRQRGQALSVLLSLAACIGVILLAAGFFQPILDAARKLQTLAGLGDELTEPLFKILGISLVTHLAAGVCTDAGEGSVARAVELAGGLLALYAGLPLLLAVLELVQQLLEEVA